jgi:RNase H-fold protein (predicted Holliday junction resolvase)
MTQHFNWGYDRRESRQEYLEDRITQMGHEPDQYEQWHAELEALKAQKKKEAWPGGWGEKTTKKQWSLIERAIGRKLSHATDGELAHAAKSLKNEIKRRKKTRERIRNERLTAKIAQLEADGYEAIASAAAQVRQAILDHGIFPGLDPDQPSKTQIQNMVEGKGPWSEFGPMTSGILRASAPGRSIYVKPKMLLCFVINRRQQKIDAEKKRQEAYERRQEELRKWEEIQKARSAQVAKDWYQQMQEANGRWKQALADHEARKAEAAKDVPAKKTAQSLPDADQEGQNG